MKPLSLRTTCAALAAALSLSLAPPASAEDIDLFTNPAENSAKAPNILIVLDNSANWNANNQQWVGANGENPFKQGQSELRALRTLMDDPNMNEDVNLGLFMFASGGPADTGYPRFHIRPMSQLHKDAFKEMIGDASCSDGANSLNGTPNCLFKNFSRSSEQTNSASTRYSAALFEAFKYFGGYTDPAHANLDVPGTPIDRTHFGNERYGTLSANTDRDAWEDPATKLRWGSPLDDLGNANCAKNYIIFIGNGYPSQDVVDSLLTGINGNATVPGGVGNKNWKVANWSKYMLNTDVNAALGKQSIFTYTIDVFNAQPDANQTALMKAMAKHGGGRYFEAKSEEAILAALRDIITEIQAVNSVFASASLPINATNRSQNENQVFIGMFRPDGKAEPRWYGNLKQYQIALFGNDARLADAAGEEAVAASTGFLQACAKSFWSVDSGAYWEFSDESAGTCTTSTTSIYSDLPDGNVVEKGGAGEVLRRGNDPTAVAPFTVNRTMYTCAAACGSMVAFNTTNVSQARLGVATAADQTNLVNYTRGEDVLDEDGDSVFTEPRPSIHADIAHSRPLPVNFGGTRRVVVYYGSNDGPLRAVEGATGKELWSFIAPEHHAKLKRLYDNLPLVDYPNLPVGPVYQKKDYFFDGSMGLYQNLDNSKVWIFPTMRRGGRMMYAFDVTSTTPSLKWALGCPNAANDTGCTSGASGIGQTWSVPNVAFVQGFGSGTSPVIVMGGGYDSCEDVDAAVSTCTSPKGNKVYIINADTGAIIKSFDTERSVAADVTLIDRNFDSKVDHAYVADMGGAVYRIDFVDPASNAALASTAWTITKIAKTSGGNRKFLFGPSALAIGTKVYLALGSGDRERPLITNYPYTTPVQNRFYSFYDSFVTDGSVIDLDGADMENFTTETTCDSTLGSGKKGWFMDLAAGVGEQTVTSSVIFGGVVFFSTNRPEEVAEGTCATNLGEARGYAVNLFNASGVIGSGQLCGGGRSGEFTGGGIPPSPVVGTVPVSTPGGGTKTINVLIGGIDLGTGTGSPIGAQQPPVPIKQIRSRVFWYPKSDR